MKKLLALSLLGLFIAGQASALNTTGSVWSCPPPANQANQPGYQWCRTTITSGTTATQLGTLNVNPKQLTMFTFGVSGSAVSGLVTPTINYYVGNRVVATQNVSATSAGNVVVPLMNLNSGTPLFTAISISQSTPSLISSTNGLVVTVQQNDK